MGARAGPHCDSRPAAPGRRAPKEQPIPSKESCSIPCRRRKDCGRVNSQPLAALVLPKLISSASFVGSLPASPRLEFAPKRFGLVLGIRHDHIKELSLAREFDQLAAREVLARSPTTCTDPAAVSSSSCVASPSSSPRIAVGAKGAPNPKPATIEPTSSV